jgi:hypothetical protein
VKDGLRRSARKGGGRRKHVHWDMWTGDPIWHRLDKCRTTGHSTTVWRWAKRLRGTASHGIMHHTRPTTAVLRGHARCILPIVYR